MRRREFLQLIAVTLLPILVDKSHLLAAMAETILPASDSSPGANGKMVVRFVEVRCTDKRWRDYYAKALTDFDLYVKRRTGRAFTVLPKQQRLEVIEHYAAYSRAAEDFLKLVKQDAVNELFTTRAGLKWLGYRGKAMARWGV